MSGTALTKDPAAEEEFVSSLYKGGELLAANKVVEAREHLEKANRLRPKNEKAQNLLGLTYFKLGLFDQASEVYEALVRENPADPTLRVNLGLVYLKTNNLERSVHEFETATDLEPTHKKAHNYLGLALAQAGDYTRARDHFIAAGSDAMADKMSKAMVARVENAPPTAPMTVSPAPPASAPTIPVTMAPSPSAPATPAALVAQPPPAADDDLIDVMSDEQEPPSGEMPAVLAEEVAVDGAEEAVPPGLRPSQPSLETADWGSQLNAKPSAPPPAEDVMSEEPVDEIDDDQLIGAEEETTTDTSPVADGTGTYLTPTGLRVDAYGEPVTGQQFPTSSERPAQSWPADEPRELVAVESLTPEPTAAPPSDTPAPEVSWGDGAEAAPAAASSAEWLEQGPTSDSVATTPNESWGGTEPSQTSMTELPAEVPQPVEVYSYSSSTEAASTEAAEWVEPDGTPLPTAADIWEQSKTSELMARAAETYVQSVPDPFAEPGGGELPLVDATVATVGESAVQAAPVAPPSDASEMDWSGVNSSDDAPAQVEAPLEAPSPAPDAEAPQAAAYQTEAPAGEAAVAEPMPDWVDSPPDPLAATGTTVADLHARAEEPEWVSQPLSEVNFTAGAVGSESGFATRPTELAVHAVAPPRATVPTYEPPSVPSAPHVDLHFPSATQATTEPHGVSAAPADHHAESTVATGYAAMGTQRLVDLGASTQWVADGERGPFHLGNDGLAVSVHGEMLVRLTNLVAVVGSVEVAPEMRRIRGRPTEQPFGTGAAQMQRVRGAGVLYLEHGRSTFHAIDLDDEGAYLREERVFAFEEPIAYENGRLTDAGQSVDLVNLKGQGRVLLQLDGPLKAMPIPVGSPMVVPLSRLVGWFGRVTPRMVGLVGLGAVELTGEGYALLGSSSDARS